MVELILMALSFAMGALITRNVIILRQEEEPLQPHFLGFASHWSERGRASEAWFIFGIPIYAKTFNHSTFWHP